MSELNMAKDYWWESDGDYYRPNTQNLKNFKPTTGLLHHFYGVYIHDRDRFNDVVMRPFGADRVNRVDPMILDALARDLSPFQERLEEMALLVMPGQNERSVLGTYALVKKISGQKLFIRPERSITVVSAISTTSIPPPPST